MLTKRMFFQKHGRTDELENHFFSGPSATGQEAFKVVGWTTAFHVDEKNTTIAVEHVAVNLPAKPLTMAYPDKRTIGLDKHPLQCLKPVEAVVERDGQWYHQHLVGDADRGPCAPYVGVGTAWAEILGGVPME